MMLERLREFNSYGNTDAVSINAQLPTPNSQARRTFGALEVGDGSWKLGVLGVACPSARQTIPGAEDLAQKPLVFFVNLDTL